VACFQPSNFPIERSWPSNGDMDTVHMVPSVHSYRPLFSVRFVHAQPLMRGPAFRGAQASATVARWPSVGVQPNSVARWFPLWFRMSTRGKKFFSSFISCAALWRGRDQAVRGGGSFVAGYRAGASSRWPWSDGESGRGWVDSRAPDFLHGAEAVGQVSST
jgi:hypothetical protein